MREMKTIGTLCWTLVCSLPLYGIEWSQGVPTTVSTSVKHSNSAKLNEHEGILQSANLFEPRIGYVDGPVNTDSLPQKQQNPNSQEFASTQPANIPVSRKSTLNKTSISPNFTAVTYAESRAFPPDTNGAVGPQQFIACVNGRLRSFNKSKGTADGSLDVSTDIFFESVADGHLTRNPRIRYDRFTERWYILATNAPQEGPNQILLAVSDGLNHGIVESYTGWRFYAFTPASLYPPQENLNDYAEFPTLGVDVNALYIGINVFSSETGQYRTSDAFVVKKSMLIEEDTLIVTAFRDLVDWNSYAGPISPEGVDNFDSNATEGYFIGVDGAQFGKLILRRVKNPGGVPSISDNIELDVLSTKYPILVPHKGNDSGQRGLLDSSDDRLCQSHVRDGRLYTAHNVGVDNQGVCSSYSKVTRNGCRWYEIDLSNPEKPQLTQAGTLFEASKQNSLNHNHYWMPSVMTNGLHTLVIGASTAGTNSNIDAAFSHRHENDLRGTLRQPFIYTHSQTTYNPSGDTGFPRRWGDYSTTSVDPQDNMTIWTIQQFCDDKNSYGCQVVRIPAAPPAEISSCQPSLIASGIESKKLLLTGISNDGSGYYDPDSSFSNHLSVAIDGGVQVLSTKLLSPTQILLEVSTVGAEAGVRTISIFNPDGQIASAKGFLTIK